MWMTHSTTSHRSCRFIQALWSVSVQLDSANLRIETMEFCSCACRCN